MGMEKKNPYVTTIGFNRKDPSHVHVAKILNEMGRGKAQYIVNAVMEYQERNVRSTIGDLDYEKIRRVVEDLLKENYGSIVQMGIRDGCDSGFKSKKEEVKFPCLDKTDMENIIDSLNIFKQ